MRTDPERTQRLIFPASHRPVRSGYLVPPAGHPPGVPKARAYGPRLREYETNPTARFPVETSFTAKRYVGCSQLARRTADAGLSAHGEADVPGQLAAHVGRQHSGLDLQHPAVAHPVAEDRVSHLGRLALFVGPEESVAGAIGELAGVAPGHEVRLGQHPAVNQLSTTESAMTWQNSSMRSTPTRRIERAALDRTFDIHRPGYVT
jgi:hypothetical protein